MVEIENLVFFRIYPRKCDKLDGLQQESGRGAHFITEFYRLYISYFVSEIEKITEKRSWMV